MDDELTACHYLRDRNQKNEFKQLELITSIHK